MILKTEPAIANLNLMFSVTLSYFGSFIYEGILRSHRRKFDPLSYFFKEILSEYITLERVY